MDRLNLEITWDINNDQLKASMDQSRKSIEGVGQTVEVVEKKVNDNVSKMMEGTQQRIDELRGRIALIKSDLERWTGPNSTLGLSIDDPAFDKYYKRMKDMQDEIDKLNSAPVVVDVSDVTKNANEASEAIDGIDTSVDKVKKSGKDAFKDVIKSFFSWNSVLTVGLTLLTMYGKDIVDFFVKIIAGNVTISQAQRNFEALNAVMAATGKEAAKELAHLKVLYSVASDVTRSTDERTRAVKELQKTYPQHLGKLNDEIILTGQASQQYKELTKSILESARARAAEKRMEDNASKRIALEWQRQKVENANRNEKLRYAREGDDTFTVDAGGFMSSNTVTVEQKSTNSDNRAKKAITEIDAQISVLEKEDEFLTKFVKVEEKKEKVKKPKRIPSAENALDSILDSRRDVQQKIDEINREYARKGMESDEAEIQAVKDKFIKIRQTIENENEKIARYNEKNKDKKGFRAVGQIDVSQLDAIEQRAIDEVTYKQGTAKLEQEIEVKKKLFSEYEDYRAKLGKEKADQRYKDELAGFESLTEYLRAKSLENQDTIDAYTNKTADAGQEERAKLLKKETDEATSEEKKKQTDVLALMISYDQKRKNLISDYEANRAKLMKSATAEELAEFDRRHTEELNELDDSNIQKLQSVKDLFDGIERLTDNEARKVIRNIELLLASGVNISPELLKKVREALKDATKSLDSRLPERVMQTSNAFSQMAREIGVVNEGLGNMFSVLGHILSTSAQIGSNLGDLRKGLKNYKDWKLDKANGGSGGGLLGGISAIAGIAGPVGGIVSSVSGIVSGVIGFFNAAKESARQAAKQMKEYQESVLAGEYEYNRLLRERAREHKGINELTVEQIRLQQELLKLQTTQAESDFKSILKRIQSEGQQITGQRTEKYGGFLGIGKKTRVVDITSGLSGYTYDQLEKLYTSNKLTEATKKLFEELKKAKEEIDGIGDAWDDMQKELLDKMSGGATADSIASTIIQGFRDGKRAVVDFADSAEEIIQNALLSAMSATVLEEPLQELVKKFREDAKDGLSQNEIDDFKKAYGEVVQSGIDAMKEIDKLTGKTGSSTPTGRINAGTSEATSSAILGFERSRYDLAKQHLQAALAALDFEKKSYDQILESVRYLKAIEQNTKDTVAELKNAVVELKAINKNTTTKSGRTTEGMGL